VGLLSGILGLPFAPLRGTVWLAEQIAEEADRRMNDPAFIRQQLEAVAAARESGDLAPDEADRIERDLVARLLKRKVAGRQHGRG
jgi:chorismate mutase